MANHQQHTPVITAFTYEMAPNPQKLFHFLALYKIPFNYAQLPETLPRPMLTDMGITYRRTPLLSIDGDIYIDTALIVDKLAEIAAARGDHGLEDATNHVEYDGLSQLAFECAATTIPPDFYFFNDEAFIADREELSGGPFNPTVWKQIRPKQISKTLSFVTLVQSHLLKDDGRKFFLGGDKPTTADIHLYWAMNWGLRFHEGARPEISEKTFPRIFKWMEDVEGFLKGRRVETKIPVSRAKESLLDPGIKRVDVEHVQQNPEGLEKGQRIKVTPVDSGRNHPQFGELLGLGYAECVVKNDVGVIMHFPRLGYEVVAA